MDVPQYVGETRFYRKYLGISYEFGSFLRKRGVLSIDAQMQDGRPLFLTDLESVERHKSAIRAYRARQGAAKHNVKALSYA